MARGTLAIDVSGPHLQAANDARYALITTLTLESGESLPFVEHLRNRKHQNILRATLRVLAKITSLAGGRPSVFRIHSDNALEFWAERFVESLESLGLWVTKTVPHCPQSNGRTERMIQQINLETAIAILHGRLSPKLWPYALSEAAFMRRAEVLNIPIPSGAPRPGDHVLIKKERHEALGDRTFRPFICHRMTQHQVELGSCTKMRTNQSSLEHDYPFWTISQEHDGNVQSHLEVNQFGPQPLGKWCSLICHRMIAMETPTFLPWKSGWRDLRMRKEIFRGLC